MSWVITNSKTLSMKTLFALFLVIVLCISFKTSAQFGVGVNLNKNYYSYPKKATQVPFGNTGAGLGFFYIDTNKRFINYEVSLGIDYNYIAIVDMFYNPPVVDYTKKYTHEINIVNINPILSLKKYVYRGIKSRYYLGAGINPKWFFYSTAKTTYNDSLYYGGKGVRLIRSERLKLYDLFYAGIELNKKIGVRFLFEGFIRIDRFKRMDFYYRPTENNVKFKQVSLQIILHL